MSVAGGELDGRDEVFDGGGQVSRGIHATEHPDHEHVLGPEIPGLESEVVSRPELPRLGDQGLLRAVEALHGPEAGHRRLQQAHLRAQQAVRRVEHGQRGGRRRAGEVAGRGVARREQAAREDRAGLVERQLHVHVVRCEPRRQPTRLLPGPGANRGHTGPPDEPVQRLPDGPRACKRIVQATPHCHLLTR